MNANLAEVCQEKIFRVYLKLIICICDVFFWEKNFMGSHFIFECKEGKMRILSRKEAQIEFLNRLNIY